MKYLNYKFLLWVIVAILLASCAAQYETSYRFHDTFDVGSADWVAGFADLPADYEPDFFELDSGWGELPSGLAGNAIYIRGNNHSDDLFMYFQKHITGLRPNTLYQVQFEIELASNTPAGLMGIGGSPGESVYVKAGAVSHEPEIISDSIDWLRIDIDKGNQASEGEDMINLGTLANPNIDLGTFTGEEYALMDLDNQDSPFGVTSDEDGSIWVMIGSDSGFEGPTTVFYHSIDITLTEADLEAAADILADALIVEVAEEVEAEAMDDYSEQEDLIAEAEDALEGDLEGALLDDDLIADAEIQKEIDKEVVLESETVIAAAYLDAASALVAAELIDEADLSPVAVVIADMWVSEEDID